MITSTPLIFRPSVVHRTLAILLCAGSWVAGIHALVLLVQHLPHLVANIQLARVQGDPTFGLWVLLVASVLACLCGGLLLVMAALALVLIEGTQVVVDEMGLAVEHNALPGPLARHLGAGRLGWKQITHVEQKRFVFVIRGGAIEEGAPRPLLPDPTLRFLLVDELERLIFIVLERSPNLKQD